ncbi:hypothetical protein ABZX30_35625 [Streptomyces sp. NPDC004542]|uniref:hypothetical protein n=1 Tax=Streptomyces sp. NPDC004542 TaxID=3154281 RepID=UPI0033A5FBD7
MNDPVSLIVNRTPVPRMALGPTKATQPHLAVVYATASGEVECFDGRPMTPSQQVFSRYRTRYEVDLRPRQRSAVLGRNPLVSRDGVHAFEVKVDFAFRVDGWEGAKAVVRSGIDNPLPLVHNYLTSLFHGAGQRFAIEDSFGLQHYLNQRCGRQVTLAEGLIVYGCQVTVRPDDKSKIYLESLIEAGRREALGQAEHVPDMGEVLRRGQLDAKKQELEIAATARQAAALENTLTTSEGLIRHYLITHPEDAAGAFEMMRKLEEARFATTELQNQRALGLLQLMAEKNLVQAGDLDATRQLLTDAVGRATGGEAQLPPAATPQLTGARPWDAPPAQLSAARAAAPAQAPPAYTPTQTQPTYTPPGPTGPAAAAPYGESPGSTVAGDPVPPYAGRPATPAYTALIYLVLDESLDRTCLEELNRGLSDLHSALSSAPELSTTLRLSVLGMAATTEPRLQLETVTPGTRTPVLTGRPGLSYAHAFQLLSTVLGQDVGVVKAEGAQVLRPIVHFVTGGTPEEGNGWRDAHRTLTDTTGNPAAPHVIALGLGRADTFAIRAAATRPEFAFMAPPHQDAVSAAHSCAAFLRDSVVGYARRIAAGDPQFAVGPPDGFRRAEDAF